MTDNAGQKHDHAPTTAPACNILVSGDVVVDHHLYQGERHSPVARNKRGIRHVPKVGGAAGLWELIEAISSLDRERYKTEIERRRAEPGEPGAKLRTPRMCKTHMGVKLPDENAPSAAHHAFALWTPHQCDPPGNKRLVWRANLRLGYGHEPIPPREGVEWRPEPEERARGQDLLVLDDAGFIFRNAAFESCWHIPPTDQGCRILLKLASPIAQGDLWRRLVPHEGKGHADQLVCMVSASELRAETALIGHGASWERTLEDLSEALDLEPLSHLKRCRHLVITFGIDAALWLQPSKPGEPGRFCFAPGDAEGDYADGLAGDSVGYLTAMAGSLAYGMSQSAAGDELNLFPWIEAGLHAMRDLLYRGHGEIETHPDKQPHGFPSKRLSDVILTGQTGLAKLTIQWPVPSRPEPGKPEWSLVEASQRPFGDAQTRSLIGLASAVLHRGVAAYGTLPHAGFGKFITAERREIEVLRSIRAKMRVYRREAKTGDKPLCVGVFGPPGAGKSFAVKEIAKNVFGEKAWMEFNLSQFNGADLNGALHQVRDKVLDGVTPVVFWDEFDSQGLLWLRSLLAPMQDGRFQDGPLAHAVGKCVFIFAGGTAANWETFGEPEESASPAAADSDESQRRELRRLKAPDFKSRLDAFYDVSGPNPRTGNGAAPDVAYVLRRAFLIRGLLGLERDQSLDLDADLVRALLTISGYRHGARSVEKLVKPLYLAKEVTLSRSELPPRGQLQLYVDETEFFKILGNGLNFQQAAPERIAPHIHAAYLEREKANKCPVSPRFDKPYDELDAAAKNDNLEAARRIPWILALAGLGVMPGDQAFDAAAPDDAALQEHLKRNIERLAEAEHDGWCRVRRRNGWEQGEPRNDEKRVHPMLLPYASLPDPEKERDSSIVLAYPNRLAEAGYRIVWLETMPAIA